MNWRFKGLLALLMTLILFPYAHANLGFRMNPEPLPSPQAPSLAPAPRLAVPVPQAQTHSSGVVIQYSNLPLGAILQNISDETGLEFHVNRELSDTLVSANISAPDWRKAVEGLLAKYSRVELWADEVSASRIWLLGGTPRKDATQSERPQVEARRAIAKRAIAPTRERDDSPKITLSMLPPHILLDPGLLMYLKSNNIELPQEFRDQFETVLEGLPKDLPISPSTLNDPQFGRVIEYLKSIGAPLPEQLTSMS